ncbi:phenylacetate--CoA ligase family protein, partial [candidate division KSB1 bacterium]|nr:phenylacetate--CoA ligase family protein [candidate division KSB1 bacterium]
MKYLQEVESKSGEQICELQNEKLARLLLHAYDNIPYYEGLFSSAGLGKNKNSLVQNFATIPVLTKEIIQEQGEKLYSKDYKNRGWYKNSTGGSTGEPVTFIQDKQYKAWGLASQYHEEKKLGKDLGQPGLKLWGSERDISRSKDKFVPRAIQWLQNQVVLNCFRMTDENIKKYIHAWNRQKPRLVTGYVSALFEFARQVQNLKSELHRPDAIISAAETLSENTRDYIEEIFYCPVVNLYGSRETGLIACECLKKEGLHICSLHTKVEILTDDLRPCQPGQIGNIYITTLDNYSMPLIRYRIGDTAIPTDKTCSCGNPHPLIEKITGRQMEVFKTINGTIVPGEFFIH